MTLKELFSEWADYDIAMYYLACLFGMMKYDDSFSEFRKHKHLFATKNEMSDMFYELLERMVEGGILENDDEHGYRWNKEFKGTHYWKMESI